MRQAIAILTVLIGLLASTRSATAGELERALLELVVNGAVQGDVPVLLRNGDVLVPMDRLREAGLARLRAPTEKHADVEYVSLRAASPPLSFTYDDVALTVSVVAPPGVLARTAIDLSPHAPPEMRYEYDPSFFVNYAPRLIDGRHVQVFGETGLSLGAALGETSATWDPERGATRLTTRAIFDDRKHLRTATLGDAFVSAGPLGGAMMLGGLSVARNYELDPYFVKIPRLGYTGSAMAPSTVDVYVNDVLVRRVPVQPGEFELTNIAPVAGAGTTRYVLRDAYGGEQRLESRYYASASVLAAGLSEYSYGVGLAREGFGTESFHYAEPMFIGRHRLGITDHLTSGVHAEFDRSRVNVGSELTLAGEFGEFELHTAGSATTERLPRRGIAGLVAYGYRWRGTSLGTFLRGATPEFSTLSLGPDQDRGLVEHVTTTGHALGSRMSLNTEVSLAWLRDAGRVARTALTLNTTLSKEIGLQVRTSRSSTDLGPAVYDLFGTLTWALPLNHFAQTSGHIGSEARDATVQLSRSMQEPTDIGYQVSYSEGDTKRGSINSQVQSSFGRAGATYTNVEGDEHTMLEVSGGIVVVGKGVYFTRATDQSFAVLEVKDTPGVRGYLNNRELGTTDARGRLFLPGLLPYQANRLSVEQADLPLDYAIENEEIVLAPPTRGGAVVTFPARAVRIVRGSVARPVGGRLVPVKYGEMSVATLGELLTSPLGEAGEFEVEGLPRGTWRGEVRSPEGTCRVTLKVPQTDSVIQSLGILACHEPVSRGKHP